MPCSLIGTLADRPEDKVAMGIWLTYRLNDFLIDCWLSD